VAVTSATTGAVLTSGNGLDENDFTGNTTGTSSAPQQMGERITVGGSKVAKVYSAINFTPDKAGSYTFLFWDDVNGDGVLGGSTEKYTSVTFTAGSSIASITASTLINNGETDTTHYSSVVKVCVKDENGNPTTVSGADSVKVNTSGSATWKYSFVVGVTGTLSGTGSADAYLVAADFNSAGCAYLAILNTEEETVTVTPSLIGGTSTPTVTTSTVTFYDADDGIATNADAAVGYLNTVTVRDSADFYVVPVGKAPVVKFTSGDTTTGGDRVTIGIQEVSGTAYGNANIRANTTLLTRTTAATGNGIGTVAWTGPSLSSAAKSYNIYLGGTTSAEPLSTGASLSHTNGFKISSILNDSDATGITFTPSAATVPTTGTVRVVVNVEDAYGSARAGIAVTASISGRNSGKVLASAITDADGNAVFSYTDTNASGVASNLSDTITFTTDFQGLTWFVESNIERYRKIPAMDQIESKSRIAIFIVLRRLQRQSRLGLDLE
ncbi:MAG: hypothetical protein EBU84_16905, partial [Actinobacteria bacterium]|nr:hypothetical protein [Actinomycetota bacterium]